MGSLRWVGAAPSRDRASPGVGPRRDPPGWSPGSPWAAAGRTAPGGAGATQAPLGSGVRWPAPRGVRDRVVGQVDGGRRGGRGRRGASSRRACGRRGRSRSPCTSPTTAAPSCGTWDIWAPAPSMRSSTRVVELNHRPLGPALRGLGLWAGPSGPSGLDRRCACHTGGVDPEPLSQTAPDGHPVDVDEVTQALVANDYLPDEGLATAIFLALRLRRPLLLEGEAGWARPRWPRCWPRWTGGRADPPPVLRGHRRVPGRLRVGLLPPAAAPAGGRGHRLDRAAGRPEAVTARWPTP